MARIVVEFAKLLSVGGPLSLKKDDLVLSSHTSNPYMFLVHLLDKRYRAGSHVIVFREEKSKHAIILLYAATLLNLAPRDDQRMADAVAAKISVLPRTLKNFDLFVGNEDFRAVENLLTISDYLKNFAMIHIGDVPLSPFSLCEQDRPNRGEIVCGTLNPFMKQIVMALTPALKNVQFDIHSDKLDALIGRENVSKNEIMALTLHQISLNPSVDIYSSGLLSLTEKQATHKPATFIVFLLLSHFINTHGLTMMHEINVLSRYAMDPVLLTDGGENQKLLNLSLNGYTIGQTIMLIGRDRIATRFLNAVYVNS